MNKSGSNCQFFCFSIENVQSFMLKNWDLTTGRILTGTLKSILQEASLHEWDRHCEHREPGRQLHDGVVYHRGLDCLRHYV